MCFSFNPYFAESRFATYERYSQEESRNRDSIPVLLGAVLQREVESQHPQRRMEVTC